MRMARVAMIGATGFLLLLAGRAQAQAVHQMQAVPDGLVQEVRDATRQFLDVNATADGHYFPVLGCVSGGPQPGAMGVHYLNGDLLMDHGAIDPDHPEALLYEFKNGKATLTAVEFIVLAADWDPSHPHQPPALRGQLFSYTGSPNRFGLDPFYSLHVWAWKDNPDGTFVDWNPKVSCDGFVSNP